MDLECYHPRTMTIDAAATRTYVQRVWDDSIVPALTEYIRIPAKSPHYDVKWKENGHIDRAVSLLQEWSVKRAIEGLRFDVVRPVSRTTSKRRPSIARLTLHSCNSETARSIWPFSFHFTS